MDLHKNYKQLGFLWVGVPITLIFMTLAQLPSKLVRANGVGDVPRLQYSTYLPASTSKASENMSKMKRGRTLSLSFISPPPSPSSSSSPSLARKQFLGSQGFKKSTCACIKNLAKQERKWRETLTSLYSLYNHHHNHNNWSQSLSINPTLSR